MHNTPCNIIKVVSVGFQLGMNLLPLILPHLNIDAGSPFEAALSTNCSANHIVCPQPPFTNGAQFLELSFSWILLSPFGKTDDELIKYQIIFTLINRK